ncbi:hypothetical protein EMN47_07430 [Prolixibacteraceae bacterium JC049]|nr:hypothetical protein [Prolixibacteraceae bacterium JC049]
MTPQNPFPESIEITFSSVSVNENIMADEITIICRGYIINEGNILVEQELHQFITQKYKENWLLGNVKELNGIFQIVVITPNEVVVINDRYGFYPLFYTEKSNRVIISQNFRKLCNGIHYNSDALTDMCDLGYVMGKETLLEGVNEFSPHAISRITRKKEKITVDESSYWQMQHLFGSGKIRTYEEQFVELWNTVIGNYTRFLKKNEGICYLPLSGGLDSRLLAYELDKKAIPMHLMSLGHSEENYDIKAALKVASLLKNKQGHFLQYNASQMFARVLSTPEHANRITCGYLSELFFYYFENIIDHTHFFMPGHSGDFLTGSHLRNRMRKWKSVDEVIDYILRFKSTRLAKQLNTEKLKERLTENISMDEGAINGFIRWDMENRQRRYIVRSCITEDRSDYLLLLPYFDNRLMDFFLSLPFELLLNQRLFVNCNLKYLYKDNPAMIQIERDRRKLRKIRNGYWAEYYPKAKGIIRDKMGLKQKRLDFWSTEVEWQKYIDFSQLSSVSGIDFDKFQLDQLNFSFLYNINQLNAEIETL